MSQLIEPTAAAVRAAIDRGDVAGAAKALAAIIAADRGADWAFNDLITLLARNGRRGEALQVARGAIVANPGNAGAHALLGTLLSEGNDLPSGEWHFRRSLEIDASVAPTLANLALNLMQQGRTAESEASFQEANRLAPRSLRVLAHWSKLREVQGDLAGAERLLDEAEAASSPAAVNLLRAQYFARSGRDAEAFAIIAAASALNGDGLLERGRLHERAGRYRDAWPDYVAGKRRLAAEAGGLTYDSAGVAAFYAAMGDFFNARNAAALPRAGLRGDVPQPLFILGAPRSGTTLVEQILSGHSAVRAGGERPWISELRLLAQRLCAESGAFPACLAATLSADQRHLAEVLRDHYLARAGAAGLLAAGARYFTDKMPFNEMFLPLIRLAFPEAKYVLLRRDPRDVAVSMLANHLTHGFNCAYRIEDIVRHLAATAGLVERYERAAPVPALTYEELVEDQDGQTRRLLDLLGLPFEQACLDFHENRRYAPTPSYAQVAERLNARAVGRWRRFEAELSPHLAALGPALTAGGYRP